MSGKAIIGGARDVNRTQPANQPRRFHVLITSDRDSHVTRRSASCVPELAGRTALALFWKKGRDSRPGVGGRGVRFPFVDYPSYHSRGHVGNKMSSGAAWRHSRALSRQFFCRPPSTVSLASIHPFVLISVSRPLLASATALLAYRKNLGNGLRKCLVNGMHVS